MRAQTVGVKESAGRILCCTVFRHGGRKLLAKGHIINDEDVRLLETEGMNQVWVTELEEGEVGEDEAVSAVAQAIGCGCIEIKLAAGGRANLLATEDCCLLVDEDLLKQLNCTANIVVATATNFSFIKAGARVATVKSAPFAVARTHLEAVVSIIHERGPLLQARPVRGPQIGILYTDPVNGDRARQLFEGIVRQRLEKFGVQPSFVMNALEEDAHVCRALTHMIRARPTGILIASTTAPAGPEDVIGRSMVRVDCHIEKFLVPVEPGNLLLIGYKDDIPIVSAPGCFRSNKQNVVDLLLPPMLSRYRISGWELAALGHGGLLS